MPENTGLLRPHLCGPAQGTGGEATSRHAASVRPSARPCARPLREGQRGGASERDVKIVLGPNGPVIQFQPKKPYREFDSDEYSASSD